MTQATTENKSPYLALSKGMKVTPKLPPGFNLHGHRGCRGLMPENSLPAFIKAVELGVQFLELDLAVSAEKELIISHEPYFSADLCYDANGNEFSDHRAQEHRIYEMNYEQIAAFDCGSKYNPRFPHQKNMRVAKPRLADVLTEVDTYCTANNLPLPFWNFEVKTKPAWDHYMTPPPYEYARLLFEFIAEKQLRNRCIVQNFDVRFLKEYHRLDPEFTCALLVDNYLSPEENLQRLGFKPDIYSPHYTLVSPTLVQWCHQNDMLIYPWTVNEIPAIKRMIELGVNGLITDYPNRYFEVVGK